VKGAKLPDSDHVVRYVPSGRLIKDEAGQPIGIFPQALSHRDGEEYLSVTWIEHFDKDYETGYSAAAKAIKAALTVNAKAGFSAANVDTLKTICSSRGIKIRVIHEPEPDNSGHCAWRGMQTADALLLQELASSAFTDTRRADKI